MPVQLSRIENILFTIIGVSLYIDEPNGKAGRTNPASINK